MNYIATPYTQYKPYKDNTALDARALAFQARKGLIQRENVLQAVVIIILIAIAPVIVSDYMTTRNEQAAYRAQYQYNSQYQQ